MNPQTRHFFENYWGIIALFVWAVLIFAFQLVSFSSYGIEENAARGLLLNWTVSDNIINPVVIFGVPDFRALLFAPVGAYWPGSMIAAKVMAVLFMALAAIMLYRWAQKHSTAESAMIATALFLVSPAVLNQIDSLGAGAYLLLGFLICAWLDQAYRAKPRYFGGWYFSQMLLVAILFTIHPLAIAYPLVLAWRWFRFPDSHKTSAHIYIGIVVAMILAFSLKGGWENVQWFSNPIFALASALDGGALWSVADISWTVGIITAIFVITVIIADFKFLTENLVGQLLLASTLVGLLAADKAWATVALVLVFYRGTHLLIIANERLGKHSLVGQRGIVIALSFVMATFFMMEAKNHHYTLKAEILSPEDELIRELADVASDESKAFRAASQWPGRTMLAAKRDVLPLPPAMDNPESFYPHLQSVTHIIFNQNLPQNQALANNIAELTGATETIAFMKAGVIVEVRDHKVEQKHYRPPVDTGSKDQQTTHDTNQEHHTTGD